MDAGSEFRTMAAAPVRAATGSGVQEVRRGNARGSRALRASAAGDDQEVPGMIGSIGPDIEQQHDAESPKAAGERRRRSGIIGHTRVRGAIRLLVVALCAVTVGASSAAVASPRAAGHSSEATMTPAKTTLAKTTLADPGAAPQAVPGGWTLAYDWGCDGSYRTTSMNITANGRWTNGEGYTGPWASVGAPAGMLIFAFDGYPTTYAGNLAGGSVTGIQTAFSGLDGCFYMLQEGTLSRSGNRDSEPYRSAGVR